MTKIRAELKIELPLRTLFENPTFSQLSEVVSQRCHHVPLMGHVAHDSQRMPAMISERSVDEFPERRKVRARRFPRKGGVSVELDLSLFFFSADGSTESADKYRLFHEAVRYADRNGFSAAWIPERHFHAFGGLYPNPSVLAAAVAMTTDRLRIRAGSVVLPLQDPIRVAEEWAVVDNLSGGRVEIACASGWNANDFVLAPDAYENRKRVMRDHMDTVLRL
ncbi:hypothetical protein BH20GEM1_BH20GEM1_01370 [soil metagenome]